MILIKKYIVNLKIVGGYDRHNTKEIVGTLFAEGSTCIDNHIIDSAKLVEG